MEILLVLVERRPPKVFSIAEVAGEARFLARVVHQRVTVELEGFFEHFVASGEVAGEDFAGVVNVRVPTQVPTSDELQVASGTLVVLAQRHPLVDPSDVLLHCLLGRTDFVALWTLERFGFRPFVPVEMTLNVGQELVADGTFGWRLVRLHVAVEIEARLEASAASRAGEWTFGCVNIFEVLRQISELLVADAALLSGRQVLPHVSSQQADSGRCHAANIASKCCACCDLSDFLVRQPQVLVELGFLRELSVAFAAPQTFFPLVSPEVSAQLRLHGRPESTNIAN